MSKVLIIGAGGVGGVVAHKAAMEKQLYAKYQFCAQDAALVPSTFVVAARECGATVSNLGSLFYEQMSCAGAGYDPQRRQFAAPIPIKQVFGFGGAPLPGSREHVLHCVAVPLAAAGSQTLGQRNDFEPNH